MIEEEVGGRGAAAAAEGGGEEGDGDEETTIGGMGTDMVVMSDAIVIPSLAFLFPSSSMYIGCRVTKGRARTGLSSDDVSLGVLKNGDSERNVNDSKVVRRVARWWLCEMRLIAFQWEISCVK